MHLRSRHQRTDFVNRLVTQRDLLCQRLLQCRIAKLTGLQGLVELLRLRCIRRRLLLKGRGLVLREGGVLQPLDVHALTKHLLCGAVLRILHRQTLLQILLYGLVVGLVSRCALTKGLRTGGLVKVDALQRGL